MKLTTEIIHEESPGQRWLRLRHDFRQRNQDRIHSQLEMQTTTVATRGAWRRIHNIPVLPETHDMSGCEDWIAFQDDSLELLVPEDMADELARHMSEAVSHILAAMPDNVGLLVEDVDGPPIYNLDDEQEIIRAIDKLLEAGDAKK